MMQALRREVKKIYVTFQVQQLHLGIFQKAADLLRFRTESRMSLFLGCHASGGCQGGDR